MVALEIHQSVRLPYPRLTQCAQLPLHRVDEGREDIQHQRPAFGQYLADGRIDVGVDHDGAGLMALSGGTNAFGGLVRLDRVVDEGNAVGDETEPAELGQQAVADGFGGDPRTV
jgi:hypothetical protein